MGAAAELKLEGAKPHELGWGHTVDVDPRTGSALVSVPLRLTPGRDGFGPALALTYGGADSGAIFGDAWGLSGLPSIGYFTRDGLPRYDGRDPFEWAGEELVPMREGAADRVLIRGDYEILCLRPRIERAPVRVERWLHRPTRRIHWRVREADGSVSVFGRREDGETRIEDPATGRVWRWLLEARVDRLGNAMVVRCSPEQREASGWNGPRFADVLTARYPKRILYGNALPLSEDADADATAWRFEVVFDYGDHETMASVPGRAPPQRPDPRLSGRSGFEVRTLRRCQRILMFHRFPTALGEPETCVGATSITYGAHGMIERLEHTGYRRDGGVASARALRPLVFNYSPHEMGDAFEDVPESADTIQSAGRMVDLFHEGVPGLLTECPGGGAHYARGLGGGRFAPREPTGDRPAHGPNAGAVADFDLDGDGELFVDGFRFHRLGRNTELWQPSRTLARAMHDGAPVQRADLTGSGRADLVQIDQEGLTYWPSLLGDGWGEAVRVDLPVDRLPLTGAAVRRFLVDMTGDGVADLVAVGNGSVTYWPGLGRGRFGEPVVMEGAPLLAHHGELSVERMHLVDVTGTGTADLLYLGPGYLELWVNDHGNGFRFGARRDGLPPLAAPADIHLGDLLSDGTLSLAWAPRSGEPGAPLRVLRLQTARPRELESVEDTFGAVDELTYESSAAQYLRDREAGTPWSERAGSHRAVVVRQTRSDQVAPDGQLGGATAVIRFTYRNARYDGHQRRFVGFVTVDRVDGGRHPALRSVPTWTRTIYHTGDPSFGRQGGLAFYGSGIDPPRAGAFDWTVEDEADAWSALAGQPFQTEIRAMDADEATAPPALVVGAPLRADSVRAIVERLSPRSLGRNAAFAVRQSEQLQIEIDGQPFDPRRIHTLALEVDAYGYPVLSLDVAYPRASPATPPIDAQHRAVTIAKTSRGIHVDTAERFELGAPAQETTFELAMAIDAAPLRPADVVEPVRTAVATAAPYDDAPWSAPADGSPRARVVAQKEVYYYDDAIAGALPLRQVGAIALVHHEREACFDDAWIRARLEARYTPALLEGLFYEREGATWWRNSPVQLYEPATRFHRLAGTLRADGATRRFEYDDDALALSLVIDAALLSTSAQIDYFSLAPERVEDPNGTVNEVQRDALGVVVRRTLLGTARMADGSIVPHGHGPIDRGAPLTSVDEVLADPESALRGVAEITAYDLESAPPRVVVALAEQLPASGDAPQAAVTLTYFDGLRRTLQSKQHVEDGPAFERDAGGALALRETGNGIRYRTTGHIVYDSAQRPVREHHPFHARTADYDADASLWTYGATKTTHFDALGRPTREDQPNGSYARSEHGPWSARAFDANDTVSEPDNAYRAARQGLRPELDDEGFALARSADHAGTPTTTHADPLGRELAVDQLLGGRVLRTLTDLDVRGEARSVRDPRNLNARTVSRDMAGRTIVEASVDAGTSWQLPDAYDRPAHRWSAEDAHRSTLFDVMDRPTEVWWEQGIRRWMAEHFLYGDSMADGRDRNALGELVRQEDQAGVVEVDALTPSGAPLRTFRWLTRTADSPNWAEEVALDTQPFESRTSYDGLGRWTLKVLPDGTERRRRYLRGGELGSLTVTVGSTLMQTVLAEARYDAFGRRAEARLGNGVLVTHTWDPVTLQLLRSRAPGIQNVERVYDASGRQVRTRDLEQEPGSPNVLAGQTVSSHHDHYYDTLYRLVRSTGRYHRALQLDDHRADLVAEGTYRGTRHVNDGGQVTRYQSSFDYDDGGNLTRIVHAPEAGHTGPTLTTYKWVSATSNRQLPAADRNGIPWSRPEDLFDREGRCLMLSHVDGIDWDVAGRLATATVVRRAAGNHDDERYQYGVDGMRVRKVRRRLLDRDTGSTEITEVITVDGGELTRIRRDDQEPHIVRWTSHARNDDEQILATLCHWQRDDNRDETSEGVDIEEEIRVRFALTDPSGSVTHELTDTGGLITYEEYFPYGRTGYVSGDLLLDVPRRELRYVGKTQDDATGLYYFQHRYYAPFIGNWMSPDPAGPVESVNLYQFVSGDPINRVDENGLCSFEISVPGFRLAIGGDEGGVSGSVEVGGYSARGQARVSREGSAAELVVDNPAGDRVATARAHASGQSIGASLETRQGVRSIEIQLRERQPSPRPPPVREEAPPACELTCDPIRTYSEAEPEPEPEPEPEGDDVELFNPRSLSDWGRAAVGAAVILGDAAFDAVIEGLLSQGIRGIVALVPAVGQAVVTGSVLWEIYELIQNLPDILNALGEAADHIMASYERLQAGEGLSLQDASLLMAGAVIAAALLFARRMAPGLMRRLERWLGRQGESPDTPDTELPHGRRQGGAQEDAPADDMSVDPSRQSGDGPPGGPPGGREPPGEPDPSSRHRSPLAPELPLDSFPPPLTDPPAVVQPRFHRTPDADVAEGRQVWRNSGYTELLDKPQGYAGATNLSTGDTALTATPPPIDGNAQIPPPHGGWGPTNGGHAISAARVGTPEDNIVGYTVIEHRDGRVEIRFNSQQIHEGRYRLLSAPEASWSAIRAIISQHYVGRTIFLTPP